MNIRWYVKKREWQQWDDRWDEFRTVSIEHPPVLQVLWNGLWVDVPTVTEVEST